MIGLEEPEPPRLRAYLALEREMRALDAIGDELAELLRDAMDSVWYELTAEQRAWLDARAPLS
jgi:hypothetical protein